MTSLEARLSRVEREIRWLKILIIVVVLLHVVIVPLLPKLFDGESSISVAVLIVCSVLLALAVIRRVA